jgi:hypothetical protein
MRYQTSSQFYCLFHGLYQSICIRVLPTSNPRSLAIVTYTILCIRLYAASPELRRHVTTGWQT